MKKESKKRKIYFGKDETEKKEKKKKNNEEFSAGLIYGILEKTPHPLRLDDILKRADVTRRSKKEVLALLHDLILQGKIVCQRGGAYSVSTSLKNIVGTLAVQRSGAGFVNFNKEHYPEIKEDIFIAEHNLNEAWNGDLVEVVLFPFKAGKNSALKTKRREGKIVQVLERKHTQITVRLEQDASKQQSKFVRHLAEHAYLAKPTDNRFNFQVLLPLTEEFLQKFGETEENSLNCGDLVQVKITERLPSKQESPLWLGLPEKYLGGQNKVSVQESIAKTGNGIPTAFPDDVLLEAQNIAIAEGFLKSDKEQQNYRIQPEENDTDLRSLCLVTIDGTDSRDFDDAVFAEKLEDGFRLVVAIADVSRYVTPYSKLDKEAQARGNSYYFPASVEPMLPQALSNGLCSLRPNEDHRIMFAEILFGPKGKVKETSFGQGIMRSKARLTYEAVQEFYDTGTVTNDKVSSEITEKIGNMLTQAKELAEILIKKRRKAGSLHLEIPEQKCIVKNDVVVKLGTKPHFFAHELIEAFMVAANEAVAEFLHKKHGACLYRIHPAPAPERLRNLSAVFSQSSLINVLPSEKPAEIGEHIWLSQILNGLEKARQSGEQTADNEENDTIAKHSYLAHRMILRSMMQARYSPFLDIHFGLASRCYCHFTSPIRRYADLMVHRSLKAQLGLMDKKHKIFQEEYLENIADLCNERERTAQTAEREVFRRLSCLLLEKSVGETFTAVISGLSNFGVFAELQENMAEGMIPMDKLGSDYFVYDEDRQILYGERTGATYKLGDEVKVRLSSVDITRLEIDLELLGVTPRRAKGKSALFKKFKDSKKDKNPKRKKYGYEEKSSQKDKKKKNGKKQYKSKKYKK